MLPHPQYSHIISPSNFYPFGKVDGDLIRQENPDEVGLLEGVIELLIGLPHDGVQVVFCNWIECVQEVIDVDGGHVS